MEKIIQLAASLPPHSKNGEWITGFLVRTLWNNMAHPPMSYLGKLGSVPDSKEGGDTKFMFRSSDGSYNVWKRPLVGIIF